MIKLQIYQDFGQHKIQPLQWFFLLSIFVFLNCNTTFAANEKGLRRHPPKQVENFQTQDKVAMIVGIDKYPVSSGLSRLQFAKADALALAEVLQEQGYTLIGKKPLINADATAGDLRHYLEQLRKWVIPGEGTVLFSFSGHGFAEDGKNYLAVHGTAMENVAGTSLAIDEVEALLQASGAKRKLVFIDACRNKPDAKGTKGAVSNRKFVLQESKGIRMLFSTEQGDVSYESPKLGHGVFSEFLLKGLRGEAAGQDGLITFHDLERFVIKNVRNWSKENLSGVQVPYTAGEASGDFLIGKDNQFQLLKIFDDTTQTKDTSTNNSMAIWVVATIFLISAAFISWRIPAFQTLFREQIARWRKADQLSQRSIEKPVTEPAKPTVPSVLILQENDQQVPEIKINPEFSNGTVLGRSKKFCHIPLPHDALSRRHIRIIWDNANKSWLVEDLNTLNGTDLDDAALSSFQPVQLQSGQTLYIGELAFSVHTRIEPDLPVATRQDDFLNTYRIDGEGTMLDFSASTFHAELVKTRSGELYLTDGLSEKGTFCEKDEEWQAVQQQAIEWTDKLKLGDSPTTAEALMKKLLVQV